MNEIERAIEHIADNVRFLRTHPYVDDSLKHHELALIALKEKLSRHENAPLTCDGCANLLTKYGSGVYMNAPCRVCVRGITTRDYYKSEVEPKGEKE